MLHPARRWSDQHVRRLDHGDGWASFEQAEAFNGTPGDDGRNFVAVPNVYRHLGGHAIDRDVCHGSFELVAGTDVSHCDASSFIKVERGTNQATRDPQAT